MRLKYKLLDKMNNLKSTEMDFLLFVARFQNLKGEIIGVHHSMVTKGTGMCKQSFYTAMRGLEEKGLIAVRKRSAIDYDVVILDNDFSYGEDAFKEGYVNLHRSIFHSKKFQKLKAHEKYMLLYFMKITHEGSGSYKIGTKTFYEKFQKELEVTDRVVRSYLHHLREFFSIGIKRGIYYITYKHRMFEKTLNKGVEAYEHEAFVEAWCRRTRIKNITDAALHDTAWLIKQYRYKAAKQGLDIYGMMKECIQKMAEQEVTAKKRCLNPKFIHTQIRKILAFV